MLTCIAYGIARRSRDREYVIFGYGLCNGEIRGADPDSSVQGSSRVVAARHSGGSATGGLTAPQTPGAVVTMTLLR